MKWEEEKWIIMKNAHPNRRLSTHDSSTTLSLSIGSCLGRWQSHDVVTLDLAEILISYLQLFHTSHILKSWKIRYTNGHKSWMHSRRSIFQPNMVIDSFGNESNVVSYLTVIVNGLTSWLMYIANFVGKRCLSLLELTLFHTPTQ